MKKTKHTRLTALMFAAAGACCLVTVTQGEILYRVPAEAAVSDSTGTTGTMTVQAYRELAEELDLRVSDEGQLIGDVNGDGTLGILDVVSLQKYLLGKKSKLIPSVSDLDGDGAIDIFDLGLLKRIVIERQEHQNPDPETPTEPPTTMETLYGPPSWFTTTTPEATMPTTQPLYGPPEWFTTTDEENTTTETTTTTMTEPATTMETLYGPPSWFTTTDEEESTTETTTTMQEPLYGPPAWFQ